MNPQSIAIIGAGVSGLVTAYLLRQSHRVELFEREPRAGGHANTVMVPGPNGDELPMDVGFIVYNQRTYPGFSRLLADLDVETQSSDMSFSVRCAVHGLEFSSRGVRGYLAQRRNALKPSHARMLFDLMRFHRDARRALDEDTFHDISFGDYLQERRFSKAFQRHLIVPLTAATWSNAPADIVKFPANYLFRFLKQHGVLAPGEIPEWRWVRDGARTYVDRILSRMPEGTVHFGEAPSAVRRTEDGVVLAFEGGHERQFDAVVLACHAPEALRLLGDPSPEETDALGRFHYAPNHVVLHTDERLLPRSPDARASWNYFSDACSTELGTLTMSYDLNRLQGMTAPPHYCVTVNPGDRVDPAHVLAEFDYEHPVYSMQTLEGQQRLNALNGNRSTYFAGAYLGYGFHEDGVQSGIRVAQQLGVEW